MDFFEDLNKLEHLSGSSIKIEYLAHLFITYKEAEAFFKVAFSSKVLGIKAKTISNYYGLDATREISETMQEVFNCKESKTNTDSFVKLIDIVYSHSGADKMILIDHFLKHSTNEQIKWYVKAILKDLKIGMQIKSVNQALKLAKLPKIEKFAMQLCNKLDVYDVAAVSKKIRFPVDVECKYDGYRIQATKNFDEVELMSRRGNDKTADYPEIVEAIKNLDISHIILDGEIIANSFQELTRSKTASEKYFVVFDILNDESLTYSDRYYNLMTLLKGTEVFYKENIKYKNNKIYLAEHKGIQNIKELQEYYELLNEREEEGIIIKLDTPYKRGSRCNMFKCKKVYTADLLCYGAETGTGKRLNKISTLKLKDKSGTVVVDVGSGISDNMSDAFTADESLYKDQIIEIKFNERTSTGSLRFPRFVTIRDDKDEADDMSTFEVRQ